MRSTLTKMLPFETVVCWLFIFWCDVSANYNGNMSDVRMESGRQQRIKNSDAHLNQGQSGLNPFQLPNQDITALPMVYPLPASPSSSEKAFVPVVNLVDPLVIFAIFALPLLGLLGLGAFLFPLLPIGIYLLITYLPGGAAGRKKRASKTRKQEFIEDVFSKFLHAFYGQ